MVKVEWLYVRINMVKVEWLYARIESRELARMQYARIEYSGLTKAGNPLKHNFYRKKKSQNYISIKLCLKSIKLCKSTM